METIKQLIIKEFEIDDRMKTAEVLKKKESLSKFSLSSIKSNLSRLKKLKKLVIGFRIRGRMTTQINAEGNRTFLHGKCYYAPK